MAVISVIVCIGARSADPRRSCVGERRGLSFNTSVLVIAISDEESVQRSSSKRECTLPRHQIQVC